MVESSVGAEVLLAGLLDHEPMSDEEAAARAVVAPSDPPGLAELPASGFAALELDWATACPEGMPDDAVLDGIVGLDRVISWAQARQARLLAEFLDRRGDTWMAVNESRPSTFAPYAPDEVGVALRISRGSAQVRLAQAHRLVSVLPAVLAEQESGALDAAKVRTISDAVWFLPAHLAAGVAARVLPRAPEQSTAQLRAAVAKAILAVDPDGANRRHRAARTERRVTVSEAPEGMASLWALLSAPDARSAWEWLTRLARGLGKDDPRPMDARRADLLVALLTGKITLDDRAGDDVDDDDGRLDDGGAAVGDAAADGATDGGADAGGAGDATAGGSGAATVAAGGEVGSVAAEGVCDPQPTRPARERLSQVAPGKPLVQVVVPYSTLTGADEQPCELAGYGPIPAELAREIAADAVWRRLLTDPASGTLLDYGRTTYHPPAGLADHVRGRDLLCRGPRCRRPAAASELDHHVPYPEGSTREDNLAAHCKHDHDLKHRGGWQVIWHPDRTLEWITPTGYRCTTRPYDYRVDPLDLEHGLPDPQPDPPPPPELDDDPPPF